MHNAGQGLVTRNLLISSSKYKQVFPKNKCAVRHKILVETKFPHFFSCL